MPRCFQKIVNCTVLLVLAGSCLAATRPAWAQRQLQSTATLGGAARLLLSDLIIEEWDVVTLRPLDTGVSRPVSILELTVKNVGLAPAPASNTQIRFVSHSGGGVPAIPKIATVLPTQKLAVGESVTLRVAIPPPPQIPGLLDFGFAAAADAGPNGLIPRSEILERSETNNSLAVTLQTF
jgi:hypothetical protein